MLQVVKAPDPGADKAEVIEILVKPGQSVSKEMSLLVLESAKATMEVPCPVDGVVKEVLIRLGDPVTEGTPLFSVEVAGVEAVAMASQTPAASEPEPSGPVFTPAPEKPVELPAAIVNPAPVTTAAAPSQSLSVAPASLVHCGPAVRRLARELGVDLGRVEASGPKGRILKEDVFSWVKQSLSAAKAVATPAPASAGSGLPVLPEIDFSRWGEIEKQPLTRIQALSAANLHRAWVNIPHVTQFDEADITELEAFRKDQKDALKKQGVNLTVLAFLVRACARLLQEFPRFNASLAVDGQTLILKKYVHVGVAVDTPNGLVVPVIRNADSKSVREIALELGELSAKARDKKLSPAEMQGGTFSISSLGGIGGTAFTPIVNWPEVAILGVSRSALKPVWQGSGFEPRLMLPLSLSYDHRVIDGAEAARFTTRLAAVLSDIRILLL
ncbi:pyruvate dehydrogenase E2 component (dihydrolipoamide acetyltransferase) [Fluviicoccus keumensis]|uniref:Acetyltransferase component of pyruvate dehydrogenase complex n=1 Tax=Fluviicoccus keumensis TaxID=1435465 RepID=A0A4V2G3G9_9GAMM|nr:dihydrolipoyllysine-residue acetyltransferase [Fluviicoccus keumensis]RZU36986.1 pyruvate dehydrogenase E2 component (dihydrolipoamide acetyltransferase) [Fluviicoccus keumensis]